jgi:3-dehydroquinate synthase
VLPQGEGTKSLECFGQLLTVMLEHGFTRGDTRCWRLAAAL